MILPVNHSQWMLIPTFISMNKVCELTMAWLEYLEKCQWNKLVFREYHNTVKTRANMEKFIMTIQHVTNPGVYYSLPQIRCNVRFAKTKNYSEHFNSCNSRTFSRSIDLIWDRLSLFKLCQINKEWIKMRYLLDIIDYICLCIYYNTSFLYCLSLDKPPYVSI